MRYRVNAICHTRKNQRRGPHEGYRSVRTRRTGPCLRICGHSHFSVIDTILYDTNFDVVGVSEKSVPPDHWGADHYAALAVSGSAIWEATGGAERRRSYWLWYLQNAVPLAWDVFVPLRRD
nr:Imm5 family immunity protein [Burkholderia vietnamiensis]